MTPLRWTDNVQLGKCVRDIVGFVKSLDIVEGKRVKPTVANTRTNDEKEELKLMKKQPIEP